MTILTTTEKFEFLSIESWCFMDRLKAVRDPLKSPAISGKPGALPPFSLLRDFSFQNTAEHFAIRFRQSYLIWKVCDVTAIELSSKE